MSLLSGLIQKFLKEGQLTLVHPDGRRETLGPGGGEHVTVRFTDGKVVRDLLKNPRLMLGEAYMDGRIVFEDGDMLDLLTMIQRSNRLEDKKPGGGGFVDKGKIVGVARWMRRNNPVKSQKNVAHHYDLGNDLYDLFLDPWRQYSCAYYEEPGKPLEEAQLAKLAHIAAKLYLREGDHVLDIGCGWSGMARYLHKVAGVKVTGITLSKEQLAYARSKAEEEGVADMVDFQLVDYRKLEGQFDRIVTVGMFEHVGAAHYGEFYDSCRRLLKPDGVMLNHTIGRLGEAGSPDPFTDKWIFPGYHIPSLSQMCGASEEARMMVSDVEILRLHYAYTLRAWLKRVEAKKAEIEALYDARFYRMWEFYIGGAIVMFEHGGACNYQVQYVRDRRALPITRDYMAQTEARYRAIAG